MDVATCSSTTWDLEFSIGSVSCNDVVEYGRVIYPSDDVNQPQSHGFRFWIEASFGKANRGTVVEFRLRASPIEGCQGYCLLADYDVVVFDCTGNELCSANVEFDLIGDADFEADRNLPYSLVADASDLKSVSSSVDVRLRVRQLVTMGREEQLSEETRQRDFALLAANRAFFVDANYMAGLGGAQFEEWLTLRRKGLRRTVLLNWDADVLAAFLRAVCLHRTPVVTCRNFELLLEGALRFKAAKVLRACEKFLLDCQRVHPIRKLEIAAEFGLGMLGDAVVRKLGGGGMTAIEAVHDYCRRNNETLANQHPDVLEALDIHDNFIVI